MTLSYEQTSPAAKIPGAERLELRVADDPVVDLEPGALGEHRVGPHPGADDDHVALDRAPALRHHRLHPPVALERLELLAAEQLDPVLGEHVVEVAPDLLAEACATAPPPRSSRSCTSSPIAVSEAATSQPM